MSGDTRFQQHGDTAVKFFFLQGKAPKEIQAILTVTLREHALSYATVKNWVAQLNVVTWMTQNSDHPGDY